MDRPLKAYEPHEGVYRQMREAGVRSWGERDSPHAIEPNAQRFLEDVLAQPWMPHAGSAIELGCGTAPMLRWLHARGWSGRGVDISPTAIEMAREQSRGTPLEFAVGDVTHLDDIADASFQLALDGHCLHCLIEDGDRGSYFREVRRILAPGGIFVLMTMALPIPPAAFRRVHGTMRRGIIYRTGPQSERYEGAIRIKNTWYQPTRRVEHWRRILAQVKRAGFDVKLFRVALATDDEPISGLAVAAGKR